MGQESLIGNTFRFLFKFLNKGFIFIIIFFIFCGNLFALTLSLQCNKSSPIHKKLLSACFAFMFGFLYIIMNFYMYRIQSLGYPCIICDGSKKSIFSF